MLNGLEGEILEMILLAIMLCCILIGSNRGLILGVYMAVKNLIILAATLGIAPVLAKRLPDSMNAKEGVAYLIALVISIIVINIIGRMIRFLDDVPVVNGVNRICGIFFGALTGLFAIWAVLALVGAFQDYSWLGGVVESSRKNGVVMWFQGCNPLASILKSMGFPVI